jgi:hypothetical protein
VLEQIGRALVKARVCKILVNANSGKATGVEMEGGHQITARHSVICAAGMEVCERLLAANENGEELVARAGFAGANSVLGEWASACSSCVRVRACAHVCVCVCVCVLRVCARGRARSISAICVPRYSTKGLAKARYAANEN